MQRTGARSALLSAVVIVLAAGAIIFGPSLATEFAYALTQAQIQAERQKLTQMSGNDVQSPLFRQVAKVVRPAVVEVRIEKSITVRNPLEDFLRPLPMPDDEDNTPGLPPGMPLPPGANGRKLPQQHELLRGLGSGVIVDAKNGYVITNNHVVSGADEVEVITADKRSFTAAWIKTDPMSDIAVIKLNKPEDLVEAPLGDSDAMNVGDLVLAIGSPRGLPQTVTHGIISATGRTDSSISQDGGALYQNFLQTDAAINRGNSGGPLVNMKGEIIGINTAIVSPIGAFEGTGLAIPSTMVKTVMAQLIEKGKVTRGYLGIQMQEATTKLAKSFNLPTTHGTLVSRVIPDSPAAKAGLKEGDFIVGVDGHEVGDVNTLQNLVASVAPGKTIKLDIYRDGEKKTVPVVIVEQPANFAAKTAAPGAEEPTEAASALGITVADLSKDLAARLGYKEAVKGVVVTAVDPISDAAKQGLKPGMVITHVSKTAVATADDYRKATTGKEAAEGVRLRVVIPDGSTQFIFVTPMKAAKEK